MTYEQDIRNGLGPVELDQEREREGDLRAEWEADHAVPCSGCGARENEPCRLPIPWAPVDRVCDRQALAASERV
jgi:hypothetical protein